MSRECIALRRQLETREGPHYLLNKRMGGAQKRSGAFGTEKTLLPLLGFECLVVQTCPSLYSVYAVPSSGY